MMPKDIVSIAAAIQDLYNKIYEEDDMTEMKMHKMLYFAQKTHYQNFGMWLFNDDFEGWKHGPVNRKVRQSFNCLSQYEELTPEEEYTIREIVYDYGQYSAGVLRKMSHDDSCYRKSREGLDPDDPGDKIISKEHIINDMPEFSEEEFEEFEVD
jgi:uncharacterized phage-associated protein